MGGEACWTLEENAQPHEAHYLKLDCSKARSVLGWKPRWNMDTSLGHVVDWYKAHLSGKDMREMSMQQIRIYESAMSGN